MYTLRTTSEMGNVHVKFEETANLMATGLAEISDVLYIDAPLFMQMFIEVFDSVQLL